MNLFWVKHPAVYTFYYYLQITRDFIAG